MKISVIVPVYNSEKRLHKCIDSILNQSYSNFELLLINDGSTDRSGTICDEFAKKDKRVKVFHKENGGVSTARNTGLDIANGEYICFIDSDDWVVNTYLEDFSINKNNPNGTLYLQGHKDSYNEVITINKTRTFNIDGIVNKDINKAIGEIKLFNNGYPWCKIYEKRIIEEYNLRFKLDVHLNEDLIFNLEYYKYITSVRYSSASGYIYVHGDDSLSQRTLPFIEYKTILMHVHQKLEDLLSIYSLSKEYEEETVLFISNRLFAAIYSLYRPQFKIEKHERIKLINELIDDYYELFFIRELNYINKYVIKTKSAKIIDLYYSMLFKLRYKFSNVYKIYRDMAKS